MQKLGPEELGDLFDQPLVAVMATYRRDGGVLLSPVWHRWRDGGFDVVVYVNDIKLQHLRHDPRASIVVYEHEPPYRGLEVRGEASLLLEGMAEALGSMAVRYLGPEDGRAYAETVAEGDTVLVRIEPAQLRGWAVGDVMA